ncbi:hypothetical protein [Planctomicrobium sp. SH527]|uniref:hypothetical protein n=1 Tax=Planctomicrobium sp. SH527 TaxID=3448123 RepID=UPI003F5BB8B9
MRPWHWILMIALGFLAVASVFMEALPVLGTFFSSSASLVYHNAGSSWQVAGLLGLTTACVVVLTILFRDERKLVSRPLGLTLLGLRVCLILIVFLTLLGPTWTWSVQRSQMDRVLVAFDVSQSMETVDLQATELEKIRWAEALGLFGSAESQQRVQRWIKDLEAGKEPEWVTEEEAADPERRARMALVRKQNLQSQLTEVSALSRLELSRRAASGQGKSPLDALSELCRVQLCVFADHPLALPKEDLLKPLDVARFQIDRGHSRIRNFQPLPDTSSKGDSSSLAGIVLISDGHDTEKKRAASVANQLQGLGVPVHTVLVGSEHRPRDLAILHVDHPESVFLKDRPLVKAILQTSGFEGESLNVYLQSLDVPDRIPLQRTITPTGPTSNVEFTLPEETVGRHRYRIWTDVAPRETREDNNSEDFSFNVVDDRARVLLVDGESRWEFRFLDDALSRDPQVSLDRVLFEQPFLGILKQSFFPSKLDDLGQTPHQGTRFSSYDLVLIGDVSPGDMRAQDWQDLDRYVRQEGGTLVCMAGKRYFPKAYRGTLIEELLPISQPRQVELDPAVMLGPPPARGFHVTVTEDGYVLPMFQLDRDRVRSTQIWGELPGHLWGMVGELRAGATAWAIGLPPGQRLTLENERKNALIAQHYVGAGQVIWIGIDSTWRWRYQVGDLYHHRFWGQLTRWAVSFKASAGNKSIRLGLRENVIREGESTQVQVRLEERFFAQYPNVTVEAVLTKQGEGRPFAQTLKLVPREGNPLLLEAPVTGFPPGEFKVQLRVNDAEVKEELLEAMLAVNAELTPELQDVHVNRQLLEQLASSTGGTFLQLNELSRLPSLFSGSKQTLESREEIPLYGHWIVLVLFSTVAMTEWVLRKLNGLP